MERFSPKIEIINYFDNLINKIDIEIDSTLENFNDQQLLSEILRNSENDRTNFKNSYIDFRVEYIYKINRSKQNLDSWPESTKVVDYLNQIRIKTIEELKTVQKETIEYYKLNSERFKSEIIKEKNMEELRSELFADKFYFQVNLKQSEKKFWPFNVFTFATDFYMSQSDIDSLEKLINSEIEPFGRDSVFDDKMVLTGLLYKCFIVNLSKFPHHLIHVRKEDVLNIESIYFTSKFSSIKLTNLSTIDLSKLEDLFLLNTNDENRRDPLEFNIEGLSSLQSLHLGSNTSKVDFSIKNLPSLIRLSFSGRINEDIVTRLLDQIPHIRELCLYGNLSYFNLDSLVNLRELSLSGTIADKFNFKLFKNLCEKLEDISIRLINIDQNMFVKLFDGYNFPNLVKVSVKQLNIKRLKSVLINRFSTLRHLTIAHCDIKVIENDSFSNLEQICLLDLSYNRIEFIRVKTFSSLKNLKTLDLSNNNLTNIDRQFIGLSESVELKIKN